MRQRRLALRHKKNSRLTPIVRSFFQIERTESHSDLPNMSSSSSTTGTFDLFVLPQC